MSTVNRSRSANVLRLFSLAALSYKNNCSAVNGTPARSASEVIFVFLACASGWYEWSGNLMKIHEYQAKELLAAAGAPVPRGIVAASAAEAQAAFDKLGGGPVVLKAQVHAGGRGKGRFKDSRKDFGGVKFIKARAPGAPVADG